MPQNNTIDKPVKDIDAVGNAVEDINATNHAVEDIDAVDKAVKEADAWALARNPVYRNMQQKLIERTAERDVMRYVRDVSIIATHVCVLPSLLKGSLFGTHPDHWVQHF